MKRGLLILAIFSLAFPVFAPAQSKQGTKLTKEQAALIQQWLDRKHNLWVAQKKLDVERQRAAYQFIQRILKSGTLKPFFGRRTLLEVFIGRDGAGSVQVSDNPRCYVGGTLFIHRDGHLDHDHGIVNCHGRPLNGPDSIKNAEDLDSATDGMSIEELTKRIYAALVRAK